MEQCEAKVKEKLDKVAEERKKSQLVAQESTSSVSYGKRVKRKAEESLWADLHTSPRKVQKVEHTQKVQSKKQIAPKPKVAPPPGYEEVKEKVEDEADVDEECVVFVSNLDYNATEENVQEALKALESAVTLVKLIKDFKGRSKGYGYVHLKSKVLENFSCETSYVVFFEYHIRTLGTTFIIRTTFIINYCTVLISSIFFLKFQFQFEFWISKIHSSSTNVWFHMNMFFFFFFLNSLFFYLLTFISLIRTCMAEYRFFSILVFLFINLP